MKTSFLKINDFTRRVAMLLFVCVFTSTMVWAQFASSSDGWVIQKSSDNSRCVITDYNGDKSEVTEFPAIVDGIPVVNTSSNVDFAKFPKLETIFMYEGWEYNTMPSAQLCTELKHIHVVNKNGSIVKEDELPASIKSVHSFAFTTSKLETLNMPNVTSIGDHAFGSCMELTNITIPSGVTTIEYATFMQCVKLANVTLPDGLTSIGEYAFAACFGLTSISIPASVTTIGESAFSNCSELTSISIPASVTTIGGSAFISTSLTNVTLSGNPSIGVDAFPASTTLTLNLSPTMILNNESWMTFSSGYLNFKADDNTTVYKATTINGRLALTEVFDKIVNAGTNVFLKTEKPNVVMTSTKDASTDKCPSTLQGTDDELQMIRDKQYDYSYCLTVQSAPNEAYGTATASAYIATQGATVELTATAKEGYEFYEWSGEVLPVDPYNANTTLTMPNKHVTIIANFREVNTLNLSPATKVGKENWMTFSNGYANFKADDNTTVYKATTKANGRLALTEVLDKIVKAETTVFLKSKKSNIVMNRTTDASTDQCDNELQGTDAEIQKIKDGKFDYNYYLTVQIAPDGTGTVDASTYIAAQGEEVELTAEAVKGYEFYGWSGGAVPTNPFKASTRLIMPKKHVTIVANFRAENTTDPNTHTLTLLYNTGDPSETAGVHSGKESYVLPSPSRDGYFFLGWATTSNATIGQLDPAFKAGETVELMGNLTLYGIWQKSPAEFADKASNDSLINCISGQTGDIMLKGRTLYKDDNWNTLCLPFSVNDFADTPLEGAIVKELVPNVSSLDDDGILTLNFSDDLTAIEAGKPYIVKWKSGEDIVNPVFYDVTISSTGPTAVLFTGGQFVGNYSPFAINVDNIDEIVMLASGNRLGYSKNPRALSSCRAHFVIPVSKVNGSRAISGYVLNFEDGVTTGIIQMSDSSASPSENGGIFSLDGRRFSNVPSQKGVYVVNGKKVVVK